LIAKIVVRAINSANIHGSFPQLVSAPSPLKLLWFPSIEGPLIAIYGLLLLEVTGCG
jgi:hypothetical protein